MGTAGPSAPRAFRQYTGPWVSGVVLTDRLIFWVANPSSAPTEARRRCESEPISEAHCRSDLFPLGQRPNTQQLAA